MVLLGVLERANDPKWKDPSFAPPKPKINRFHFQSDFINLNKQLKCKQHLIPNINEVLLKWEGFQYAMPHDLDTRYYHSQIN